MASASTPGSRGRQQENTPLSSEKPDKPPLTRDASVIQQVSHFIGISGGNGDVTQEKTKWDKKRLRRIALNYSVNENEVQKFVRNRSITHAPSLESSSILGGFPPASIGTPSSLEDVERGIPQSAGRVSVRTPVGRAPIGPTPSLPNYESTSTSFEGQQRADSFSQTADLSHSQTRLSKISSHQRESVPSAVMNSVSNFWKKGSFINKKRLKLQSSFASKCSFDIDMVAEASLPEPITTPGSDDVAPASPDGIVFKTPAGEAIEMKTMSSGGSKVMKKGGSPSEKEIITGGIPEETSFEVEIEEMGDIDEAQGVEMEVSDPTALSRMTAKVRKKSSVRVPPLARFTEHEPHLTESKSAPQPLLQRFKTTSPPERPCDLQEGTRPIMHPSSSLPGRVGSMKLKKKSRQEDEVLEMLAEESDQKDQEDGIRMVARPDFRKSRSRKPAHPPVQHSISLVDEVFYDTPAVPLRPAPPELQGPAGMFPPEVDAYHPDIAQSPPTSAKLPPSTSKMSSPYPYETAKITVVPEVVGYGHAANITYIDVGDSTINVPRATSLGGREGPAASRRPDRVTMETPSTSSAATHRHMLIRQHTAIVEPLEDPALREWRLRQDRKNADTSKFASRVAIGQSKRQRGMGVFGKLFNRSYKDDLDAETIKLLAEGDDERPWFTYWMSTIQTVVCILSIILYGIGPWGTSMTIQQDDVMDVTLSNRRVSYMEQNNIWYGPHYADLIRLGAVYSPCMRKEFGLWQAIEEERKKENETGCCIANDHSGCYQSSQLICPRNVARWVRWDKPDPIAAKRNFLANKSKSDTNLLRNLNTPNSSAIKQWKQQRKSGAVCGQDPSYCDIPSSVAPYEWPDDITQWPVCEKKHEGAGLPEHVTCEVTGRPCCIQLQGLCRIATKPYCDFVRGHWHENATLCSQVNCFSGVCGMIPFFGEKPNQFYRLFTSLFVHAGIVHLVLSLGFQAYFMLDLEKLIGSKRMAILYFCSGMGGNLASAIFVPYNPAVGPSSAQCGILAANVVDLWHHRHLIKDFCDAIRLQLIVIIIVLLVGLIPWVDNWGHLFGSICGLLTTIIIFPYLDFPDDDSKNPLIPPPTGNTVPNTPLMPRGSMSTMINTAETPTMTAQGYSQLANGYPSPVVPEPRNTIQTLRMLWAFLRNEFQNKRTLYVLVSFAVLIILLLLLAIVFFGNIQFDCPWCIHFNCIPVFPCHNQGQKLKKWLPI